ncbi:MAG TPA: hypothetical protein VFV23_13230 [Verrucomicrobiae bacterium]|nr:hypothetical protein [Verrucomicrobiae bacterium]
MKKLIISFASAVSCIVLMTGCAGPGGELYPEAKATGALNPPPGKSMVLIYWVSSFAEGGLSENENRTYVYADDLMLDQQLRPGGFYSLVTEPGQLKISSGSRLRENQTRDYIVHGFLEGGLGIAAVNTAQKRERLGFEVSPDETYYLEIHTGLFQESMKPVAQAVGEKRIQDCHWLNPR